MGGCPQRANPPQNPRGGWELASSPHTGRPPLSAESLPFLGRLCWDGQVPLPQGHILTLKGERQPMGDCQHVNEPEKTQRAGQERGRSTSQIQRASERWGRNAGECEVQACHLQHLRRHLLPANSSSLAQLPPLPLCHCHRLWEHVGLLPSGLWPLPSQGPRSPRGDRLSGERTTIPGWSREIPIVLAGWLSSPTAAPATWITPGGH